ncbi:TIGR00730 family Rossman fold protein [Stappia taiwanensis]|uniref:Cytokinin riboside 5'-monophosphate phosphoribohydrolase n=1 Tax=Stappia taiwanensis TaxID=992267 RepID=A0A838XLW6_9HYPH|nr:TIGR00730 family Rossman fold protein [Stappia taiwanensis]MBA4610837.1 TIGR00730 family Rossman fold protein [Stappia taiwanensis]
MKSICVFCGSSMGGRPDYRAAAEQAGQAIARSGRRLVYGGAKVGLMGVVADAALAAGGEVVGVLPVSLQEKELAHEGLTELHVVSSMHERKAMMADLSDGFIALPGGAGTLEEIFEIWTWGQLGYHRKPCGFLNAAGYYDGLLSFLDLQRDEEFVRPEMRAMVMVDTDAGGLLDAFAAYQPPSTPKWIERSQT